MSSFLTQLDAKLLNDQKNEWQLDADLIYQSDVAGRVLTVPRGFKTDFASVPRIPLIYDLMGGYARAAATIHDHLYTTGELERSLADKVFKEAAIVSGVSKWRAWAMYLAVRAFGSSRFFK